MSYPIKNKKNVPRNKAGTKRAYLFLVAILVLTVVIYGGSLKNQLVNWDDENYLMQNPWLRNFSFQGIADIFSVFYFSNYHPLTSTVYATVYHFAGLNPYPYHLLNLLLHLCTCILVFIFFRRFSGRFNIFEPEYQ
jgi:hypothetical protein